MALDIFMIWISHVFVPEIFNNNFWGVWGYRLDSVVVNNIRFVRKSLREHVHCINQHQIEMAFVVRHNSNIDNERHPAVWQQLAFVFRPLTVGTPLRASFYIRTFRFFFIFSHSIYSFQIIAVNGDPVSRLSILSTPDSKRRKETICLSFDLSPTSQCSFFLS